MVRSQYQDGLLGGMRGLVKKVEGVEQEWNALYVLTGVHFAHTFEPHWNVPEAEWRSWAG